jgi:hypothetical protein
MLIVKIDKAIKIGILRETHMTSVRIGVTKIEDRMRND